MAARVEGDTRQLEQLADQLRAAGVELADLDPTNDEAGRVVLAQARPPRDTGRMAAGQRAAATANGVSFASTARYWTFVHWGAPRRQLRARPWFRDALTASRAELLAVYAKHARRAIGTD